MNSFDFSDSNRYQKKRPETKWYKILFWAGLVVTILSFIVLVYEFDDTIMAAIAIQMMSVGFGMAILGRVLASKTANEENAKELRERRKKEEAKGTLN